MNTTKSCAIKGARVDCNQLHEKDKLRGAYPHLDSHPHGDYIDCVKRGCCWDPSDAKVNTMTCRVYEWHAYSMKACGLTYGRELTVSLSHVG